MVTTSLSRLILALVAATLAVVASLWLAAPAEAATLTLTVDRDSQAWFWSSNVDIRQCSPPLPPPLPPDRYCTPQAYDLSAASPITPGHLPVSLKQGTSDMRTYLFFDLGNIPEGATIDSFILDLTVSRADTGADHTTTHGQPGGKAPATANEENAEINACLVTFTWGRAEGGAPSTMNPDDPTKSEPVEPFIRNGVDCSVQAKGKRGTLWTFDLTEMAQRWTSGKAANNGVVLLPERTGPLDSWTVEFHGAEYTQTIEDPATGGTTEQQFVSKALAPRVRVRYTTAAAPPTIDFGPAPPPAPVPVPTDAPLPTFQPEPLPTEAPPQSPIPTQPLGESNPQNPWYAMLVLPALLGGVVGLSRAMGRELESAGGNRVAAMVRRRRETS